MSQKKSRSFLNNWVEVGSPDLGIVRESNTGRQGERRIVALDPLYSAANEQWIYKYRRESKLPFVSSYGSEVLQLEKPKKSDKNQKKEKSDPYTHVAVITERIPNRLADSPQLTYPESLYVLDKALQGYETAYQKCGSFRVNDRMIGFNNEGHCKVWINEDFANNHPSYPRRRLMSTRVDTRDYLQGKYANLPTSSDEADLVQDVVDTVENYNQQGRFPQPFASRIHQRNLSFADARRLVRNTIQESRVPVPDRVDLFTHRVRGYRKVTTTTVQPTTTTTHVVQPVTTTHVVQPVTTTTTTVAPSTGYRFNYIQPQQRDHPGIFASRVGQQGVYHGRRY